MSQNLAGGRGEENRNGANVDDVLEHHRKQRPEVKELGMRLKALDEQSGEAIRRQLVVCVIQAVPKRCRPFLGSSRLSTRRKSSSRVPK